MICEYLKGEHKNKLKKEELKQISKSLKKLHKIKINKKPYNLKKDFKAYKKDLSDKNSKKLIKKALKELKEIQKYKFEPVLCHHDLNPQNILFYKNKVSFIDWEFSCINDRFFDLANLCIEFKLNKKEEKILLKNYLKKVKKRDLEKLVSYKKIYIILWKLWFKLLKK